MSAIARAMLLTVCFSLHLGAQSRSLALYSGDASGLDPIAIQSAKQELQRLLDPAGIEMLWKTLDKRKAGEQFDQIVVMSFDGSCAEPVATSSVRVIPPKMLNRMALTFLSAVMMRSALTTFSGFDEPPISRKLAGSPP